MEKSGSSAEAVAKQSSIQEFDALLVEQLVLHRFHSIENKKDLVDLIWIEAS
jgi:hypothetical protein